MVEKTAILLVLHHARLVDRLYRTQPHGHRGKLPVVRHQPGMRVRRQTATIDLAAKVVQLRLIETPLQERARIHTRRTVPLVKNEVAGVAVVGAAEKMIEAYIVQGGAGGKAGNMSAQALVVIIAAHHHGQRVPAHQRADAALHEDITGHHLFFGGCDGVGKGRRDRSWQTQAGTHRVPGQFQ